VRASGTFSSSQAADATARHGCDEYCGNLYHPNTEAERRATRVGNWKAHSHIRNECFAANQPAALVFNLRMDPLEQRDGHRSNLMAMKKAFLGGMVRDLLDEHFTSLKEFPPRQEGGTLKPGSSMTP